MFSEYPDVLTVKQVSEALHIGRSSVYVLINKGEIPAFRLGQTIRIRKDLLLEYIGNICYNNERTKEKPAGEVEVIL